MWEIKQESIKPIKKMLVEDNEYIIYIEYMEQENIKGKTLTRKQIINRFCKATKKGNITINFYGSKIKSNINNIEGGN